MKLQTAGGIDRAGGVVRQLFYSRVLRPAAASAVTAPAHRRDGRAQTSLPKLGELSGFREGPDSLEKPKKWFLR